MQCSVLETVTVSVRKEKGNLLKTFFGLNRHNVPLSKIETKISEL